MKYLVDSGVVACQLRQRDVDVESCYHCRWFGDLWRESGGQQLVISCEFVERPGRLDADPMTSVPEQLGSLGGRQNDTQLIGRV